MSQQEQILAWLRKGHTLTSMEALRKYGCARLAARICSLRQHHNIKSYLVHRHGKKFSKYWLSSV